MASKTPTLAELRKLAKRKGVSDFWVGSDCSYSVLFRGRYGFFKTLRQIEGALSALPDKERAR